jgi:hypothetical protein
MGRNMVTAPKPGGPILKLTEGGNLPKPFNKNGGVGNSPYGPTTPPSARTPGAQVPGFNPRRGPSAPDRANNPNRVASVIGKVGDYLGNVARSARDIPTAVGTAMDTPMLVDARKPKITNGRAPFTNVVSQVAQTIGAVGGRKDNDRSDQYFGGRTRATAEGHVGYARNPHPAKQGRGGYSKPDIAKSGIARTPGAKEQEQVK